MYHLREKEPCSQPLGNVYSPTLLQQENHAFARYAVATSCAKLPVASELQKPSTCLSEEVGATNRRSRAITKQQGKDGEFQNFHIVDSMYKVCNHCFWLRGLGMRTASKKNRMPPRLDNLTTPTPQRPESIWSTKSLWDQVAQSRQVWAMTMGMVASVISAGRSRMLAYRPPLTCQAM